MRGEGHKTQIAAFFFFLMFTVTKTRRNAVLPFWVFLGKRLVVFERHFSVGRGGGARNPPLPTELVPLFSFLFFGFCLV